MKYKQIVILLITLIIIITLSNELSCLNIKNKKVNLINSSIEYKKENTINTDNIIIRQINDEHKDKIKPKENSYNNIVFNIKLKNGSIVDRINSSEKNLKEAKNKKENLENETNQKTNYLLSHQINKKQLVIFPETELEFPYILGQCTDANCISCSSLFPQKCKECATGFFLYNNSCVITCPENFIANTLIGKCTEKKLNKNSFLMAYSIGSCVNKCGNKSVDCSCDPQCKKSGDCCNDYLIHNCDRILDVSKIYTEECPKECLLCDKVSSEDAKDDKKLICIQCPEKSLFYKGKCYKKCPQDTFINNINDTCKAIKSRSFELILFIIF